jgi:hypothetical protein
LLISIKKSPKEQESLLFGRFRYLQFRLENLVARAANATIVAAIAWLIMTPLFIAPFFIASVIIASVIIAPIVYILSRVTVVASRTIVISRITRINYLWRWIVHSGSVVDGVIRRESYGNSSLGCICETQGGNTKSSSS